MSQISNIFTSVLGWSISISVGISQLRDDHWVKVSEMVGGDHGYWDLRQWIGSQGDICICDYCLLYEYWQEIVVSHIDHNLMNTWMAGHEPITVVNSTEKAVCRWFFKTFTACKPQFLNMLNFFLPVFNLLLKQLCFIISTPFKHFSGTLSTLPISWNFRTYHHWPLFIIVQCIPSLGQKTVKSTHCFEQWCRIQVFFYLPLYNFLHLACGKTGCYFSMFQALSNGLLSTLWK